MRFLVILLCFMVNASLLSQEPNVKERDILKQIEHLRTAHLNSDVDLASELYHSQLILTSQSGKKYKKDVALVNIKNTFESYESSDIEFVYISDDVVLTNYINERKYKDYDKGKFRLTVVWTKHEDAWKIISMQSSKIREPKK
ncbi:nuclear transport factor 2 family protein [Maribacter algarum]|uniref:Nuclear transport factor 2 family protein n=1 Tax=Maribacter algarum (ex Zhang et al. 2020) TaxID=2578118 RepID=A0A5S3PWP3_9FLAO|nr:nuclear transport factor 2 family protein [Maribacter algarum]TMM58652.1 nuclear transport factor 2 family protein [Maribacter algarum]